MPGEIEPARPIGAGPHAVFPAETGDEIPTGIADSRHTEFLHEVDYIGAEALGISKRMPRFVDPVVDTPPQVLDEGASLPRLQRQFREVVFPLDGEALKSRRRNELRLATARLAELLAHAKDEGIVSAELSAELEEPLQRLASHVAAQSS